MRFPYDDVEKLKYKFSPMAMRSLFRPIFRIKI